MSHIDPKPLLFALLLLPVAAGQEPVFAGLRQTYSGAPWSWLPLPRGPEPGRMSYRPLRYSGADIAFNRVPAVLDLSYISIAAAGQGTAGLGDVVKSPGTGRYVDLVEAVLVTWARGSDWPALRAANPAGYVHRVKASFFSPVGDAGGPQQFSPLGSSTVSVEVPWRPLALPNGKPYPYNGYAFKVTIPFLAGVALPPNYAVVISFNTEKTGEVPLGVKGPYNSLNFALSGATPSVGEDLDGDAVVWVKPPQWYYPARNWMSIGSPMIKVVTRDSPVPAGLTTEAPVNAGEYHVVAGGDSAVAGEAHAVIGPAGAEVVLGGLVTATGRGFQLPQVTTVPPGLKVVLTYNNSLELPAAAGGYRVKAVVDDSNYQGAAEDDLIVTDAVYQEWIGSKLPAGAEAGGGMDADNDGLLNLVEYALGSDPGAHTVNPLIELAGSRAPVVIKRQRALPGISLIIEHSPDLTRWEEVPSKVVPVDDDCEEVRVAPVGPDRGKGFYRIRVRATGP
jgi:hypothetical protein